MRTFKLILVCHWQPEYCASGTPVQGKHSKNRERENEQKRGAGEFAEKKDREKKIFFNN